MSDLLTIQQYPAAFNLLVAILVTGIVVIKCIWIMTEIRYFKQRVNMTMLETNTIEALILFLQILVVYVLPLPKTPYDGIVMFVGIVMYLAGFVIVLLGRAAMKQSWGIPGEHHTQQDKLVTTGVFSFSRNPLYVGFFLLYSGFCVAILSWLIILRIPLFIYFYKSAISEEKLLEKTFGEEYLKYKNRVPRFLFGL